MRVHMHPRALSIEALIMQARTIRYNVIGLPKRDDDTHSTPSMTLEKNCSSEYATVEESAASAFSSRRVCP
ncbi:unnamed protein product [Angiostrongylus costaricensis]|uniref:Uncharacterized protein n=1 Tax=Angiostrongylus costaricensis TaxID=334426 RepID=A0A0R3PX90_ANGCS|nr:unnamed protein product [Angiostrongylus costaricensis]